MRCSNPSRRSRSRCFAASLLASRLRLPDASVRRRKEWNPEQLATLRYWACSRAVSRCSRASVRPTSAPGATSRGSQRRNGVVRGPGDSQAHAPRLTSSRRHTCGTGHGGTSDAGIACTPADGNGLRRRDCAPAFPRALDHVSPTTERGFNPPVCSSCGRITARTILAICVRRRQAGISRVAAVRRRAA